jgi:hypothetical protein
MVTKPRKMLFNFRENLTSPDAFIPFVVPIFKCRDLVLCNVDIWIPNVVRLESVFFFPLG